MPRISVELSELFEAIEDDELIEEMKDRNLSTCNCECSCDCETEYAVQDKRTTRNLLKEISDFLRSNEKIGLALSLDNLISEMEL